MSLLSFVILNITFSPSLNPPKSMNLTCNCRVKSLYLQPQKQGDSVAQLVEHIPFKDGVQGSNPC